MNLNWVVNCVVYCINCVAIYLFLKYASLVGITTMNLLMVMFYQDFKSVTFDQIFMSQFKCSDNAKEEDEKQKQ